MITNDFFMFISKADVNNGKGNQTRTNEMKKNGAFESILNSKKEASNYSKSNTRNNFRTSPVSNQNYNVKKAQAPENTTKEQAKVNDSSVDNPNNQSKNPDSTKVMNSDREHSKLEEVNEENVTDDSNNTYDYLASFMLGTVDLDKTLDLNELSSEVTEEQILNATTSMELVVNPDVVDDMTTTHTQQNPEALTKSNETNNLHELDGDITLNFDFELNQINKGEKEAALFTDETIELEKNISKEFKANNFILNTYHSEEDQSIEQDTDTIIKTDFDEKVVTLQNANDEKGSGNEEKVEFIEELDTQRIIEPRDEGVLSQFNDNNLNYHGKDLGNGLKTIANEKTAAFNKESIFEQIVEKVKIDMDNKDEIRIKLKPNFLGEVSLKLLSEKGVITAKAYVENYNVKQLIESNLDNLKENMKELGINFETLDVSVGKDSGFDKKNSQAWKQEQKLRVKKPSIDKASINSAYQEEIEQIIGGLYSAEGNIDITV